MDCEKSCSQEGEVLIRIRVHAGPSLLQSRDHLASGGLETGSVVLKVTEW